MELHDPSFQIFPINNNRTAWKPISLPVILIVPHKRDLTGNTIQNSEILSIRMYIEDIPQIAKVSGHKYIGMRFPDKELYSYTITNSELGDKILDLNNLIITDSTGSTVTLEEALDGDTITYTTSTGVTSTIQYLTGADYYDLSDVSLTVESLQPDIYNIVYETTFYRRLSSDDTRNVFLCISDSETLSTYKFKIDHPGRVLNEFYRLTPPPYLTNNNKSVDSTIELYRPFTDMIQDVMDEQDLLERINWVFDTPAEAIPYLSSLLGWDIPYFPQSLDQLRRAVLRRTVEFQNLKGSKRAIVNIFRLFGFEILISNLWYSSDKTRLIRPDQKVPDQYSDETITTNSIDQVDLILDEYVVKDFKTIEIPLIFRPQEKLGLDDFTALRDGGNVTITSYVVVPGSEAQLILAGISDNIKNNHADYGKTACLDDANGNPYPYSIENALSGIDYSGFSQIDISGKLGNIIDEISVGPTIPLSSNGVQLNRETNTLSITINGLSEFDGLVIYAYATYKRFEYVIPDALRDMQSNKFEIQVLTDDLTELADPTTLEFAIEFLHRLKAFHSQLYSINTRIELIETYNVTDMLIGGDIEQRYNTDIGQLQVPSAVLPKSPTDPKDCLAFSPVLLGYKKSDLILRSRILNNLEEEFEAWRSLDGRLASPIDSVVTTATPTDGRTSCEYTDYGQDKTVSVDKEDTDSVIADNNITENAYGSVRKPKPNKNFVRESYLARQSAYKVNGIDYRYKGRVGDDIEYESILETSEQARLKPVLLSLGHGVYWSYPTITKINTPGTTKPASRSSTNKIHYTGGSTSSNLTYYKSGIQNNYLSSDYNVKLDRNNESILGRLYRDYRPGTETLHYSNSNNTPNIDQKYQLALIRPSLDIEKVTLHLPGCRFPRLNALVNDYTHPTYKARPWDFNSCVSTGPCVSSETFLNFAINGDTIEFDEEDLIVYGNGITPDISSIGEHIFGEDSLTESVNVIHKVYMKDAVSNPAVTFDGVCDYDTLCLDGIIETDDPLFTSHNLSGSSVYNDFADGYKCSYGEITYSIPESTVYDDVLVDLGLTVRTSLPDLTFLLSSGVLVEKCIRLDGGCLLLDDNTSGLQSLCSIDSYLDDNDEYDFSNDNINILPYLTLDDTINTEVILLDSSVSTLLETI